MGQLSLKNLSICHGRDILKQPRKFYSSCKSGAIRYLLMIVIQMQVQQSQNFLHYSRDYWEFPIKHDTEIAQAKFVFYGPYTRSETSKSGYKFKKDSDILQRYKIIKSRKQLYIHFKHTLTLYFCTIQFRFRANFPLFYFKFYFYGLAFIKIPICHGQDILKQPRKFYSSCKSGAIYSSLSILKFNNV